MMNSAVSALSGQIRFSAEASESYTKSGTKIDRVASSTRLFFDVAPDARFSIGVESGLSRSDCVQLTVNTVQNGVIVVHCRIKELAARLHLSSSQLRKQAAQGTLDSYLIAQRASLQLLAQIITEYEAIKIRYAGNALPLHLMHIVRAVLLKQNNRRCSYISGDVAQGGAAVARKTSAVASPIILAVREPDKDLYLFENPRTTGRLLQRGAWSHVKEIQLLSHPYISFAFKLALSAKATDQALAEQMVSQSAQRLQKIHRELARANLSTSGIQPNHYATVNIQFSPIDRMVGALMKLYPYDALEFKNRHLVRNLVPSRPFDPREYLRAGLSICLSVQKLHQIGRRHRDLKCENLLLEIDRDNELNLVLSDFDGCKAKDEINFTDDEYLRFKLGINTAEITPPNDREELERLISEGKAHTYRSHTTSARYITILNSYFAILESGDIFALASTLHQWLTLRVRLPYKLQEQSDGQWPLLGTFDTKQLVASGYDQHTVLQLELLFQHMLHPNWQERPSIDQVVQRYRTLLPP